MGELERFFVQQIIDHFAVVMTGLSGLFVAAAINMPKLPEVTEWDGKWTWQVMYRWVYNTIQTVLPINRFVAPQVHVISVPSGTNGTAPVPPSVSDLLKKYGANK